MWKASLDICKLCVYRGFLNPEKYKELLSASNPQLSAKCADYTPLRINEKVRAQLIADMTRKLPEKQDKIETFFKGFRILSLDTIVGNITAKLETLRDQPEAVLCINTGWLGNNDAHNRYKSEEFLILELIRREQLQIPLYNLENLHDLPKTCILIDDACYSGRQMAQKLMILKSVQGDTEFHIVLPYVSTICKDLLEMLIEAFQMKNVTFHFGDIMETAGEVTNDDLKWLPKCEHKFHNRASSQPSSDNSSLILSTPDYKIADEISTFTAYFAQLTETETLSEHYKKWTKKDFKDFA